MQLIRENSRIGPSAPRRLCTGAAAICLVALLASPARAQTVNLQPLGLEVCLIDAEYMQIAVTYELSGETTSDNLNYDVLYTVIPDLRAPYSTTQSTALAGAQQMGRACAAPPNCGAGTGNCPCLRNNGKKPPILPQVCAARSGGCSCQPVPKRKLARMPRPATLRGSSTFVVQVELDPNNTLAESNETDNVISVPFDESLLEPCPRGACCPFNMPCQDNLAESECDEIAGRFLGEGTDCLSTPCPEEGACCVPPMLCVDGTTPVECECLLGIYLGPASHCLGDLNANNIDDACEHIVPATSESWLAVMLVLILAGGSVVFRTRRPARA